MKPHSIIAAVGRGEARALCALYEDTLAEVYTTIYDIVGDVVESADLTCGVYVAFYERAKTCIPSDSSAIATLLRLAKSSASRHVQERLVA